MRKALPGIHTMPSSLAVAAIAGSSSRSRGLWEPGSPPPVRLTLSSRTLSRTLLRAHQHTDVAARPGLLAGRRDEPGRPEEAARGRRLATLADRAEQAEIRAHPVAG